MTAMIPNPRGGPPIQRRFPLDEVERYVECTRAPDDLVQLNTPTSPGRRVTLAHVARLSGIAVHSLHRYRKQGIPFWAADRMAINLGAHPLEIWTDFYTEEDLQCA
jgi:hypothetical protein